MPEDVQSRFTVLDKPVEAPAHCVVCGAVDRPVVDFGVDVDWADQGFGRAYFCITCIKQAAAKFPDDRDPVATVSHEEVERWKQGLLDDIRSYAASYPVVGSDVPVYGSVDSVLEPTEPEVSDDSKRDERKTRRPVVKADKSDSGEGSPRLPGNSSNGPNFGFSGLGLGGPE